MVVLHRQPGISRGTQIRFRAHLLPSGPKPRSGSKINLGPNRRLLRALRLKRFERQELLSRRAQQPRRTRTGRRQRPIAKSVERELECRLGQRDRATYRAFGRPCPEPVVEAAKASGDSRRKRSQPEIGRRWPRFAL